MCGKSPNGSVEKYHIFLNSAQLNREAAGSVWCAICFKIMTVLMG